MKKLSLLILIILFSCNSKSKLEAKPMCVKKITYIDQKKYLSPSAIRIEISDSANTIRKAAESEKIKQIIFYSVDENLQQFYPYFNYRNVEKKDSITLVCLTSVYDADKKHKWTSKEVEDKLKKNIAIVIGKDTLKINSCK